MARFVLGIDGGGTRTRAWILDETGRLCGSAHSGASNYDDIGIEAASREIGAAAAAARQQAGLPPRPLDAAFLGLGGVASAADRAILKQIALSLQLAPEAMIGVDHDLRIALAGGLSGRPGIVQIAGTGSSCYGRNAAGESWRSGGWGPLIADEGSGYWLGIQAMKAATRGYDGRGRATPLVSAVLAHLGLAHMDEIMFRVYGQAMTRAEIAALAPLVIDAAQAGDETSLAILDEGAREMADCVLAVARRLGLEGGCELALTGGVFQAELTAARLRAALQRLLPGCRVRMAELPPAAGACLLALDLLGIQLPAAVLTALRNNASQR
ncbi:MAG: ATPase [Anaerolineae bacterium]|nr:ATPase [Anaerolineae bacterium]